MAHTLRWSDLNFVRRLGEGQAGQVWLATTNVAIGSTSAGQRVAVKRYKRWVFEEPGQHERIFRELVASGKVRHPNVVESICMVSDPDTLPALVMKYYEGKTLESMLSANRSSGTRFSGKEAFRISELLIDGLVSLHANGIYHRDIKPANVLVEDNSQSPIIMDLGVVSDFLLAEQTQTKDFLGTIRYSDPNYLAGGQFTAASDWYSVGLIAYELFFGVRFLGSEEHWAKLVAQKISERLPSADDLAKQCADVAMLWGQNVAEAVFHTLNTLLFEFTSENLQHLRRAISEGFWTKPFFENSNRELIQGEPPRVQTFQVDLANSFYSPRTESPPQDGLENLKMRLLGFLRPEYQYDDEDYLAAFKGIVQRQYWGWRVRGKDLEAKPLDWFWMYAAGSGDDTVYDKIGINAGILALHRYGYI